MKSFWNIILLSVFFTFIFMLAFGIFRGFEITDEGFYLLMYEKPLVYNVCASRYFIIINRLFDWLNPQIYHYRLITIIINLLGSYIFFTGLWQYLNRLKIFSSGLWTRYSAYLFIAAGNLMALFFLFKVVGYNDLNNFLVLSATGLAFLCVANKENTAVSAICLSLAGFLIAFDIMVKFPTGICYIGLLALFLYLDKKSLEFSKYLFGGLIVGLLAYFTFFESFEVFTHSLIASMKLGTGSSHGLGVILHNYFFFIDIAVTFFIKYFALPTLVFVLTLVSYKLQKPRYTYIFGILAYSLFFIALLTSVVFAPLSSEANAHAAMPIFLLLIFFQGVILGFIPKVQNFNRKLIYLVIFLLILPFLMAFGSAAPITMMAYLHLSPLFAVFYILNSLSDTPNFYVKLVNSFLSLVFIVLCVSHLYFIYLKNPFRLNDDFFAQKFSVSGINKLEHIKVDIGTAIFLEDLNELMQKADFRKDDYLIGFLMPGIVYIFDGISPGAIYYDSHPGSKTKNIKALEDSREILDKTYFLLPRECQLHICEYIEENDVLKNHEIVGQIYNPYKPNILDVPNTPLLLYKPPFKD